MLRNLPAVLLLFFFPSVHIFAQQPAPLVKAAIEKAPANPDSSLLLLRAAIHIYQKQDSLAAAIRACKDLGVALDLAGNLPKAMEAYNLATAENLPRQPKNIEEWKALGWLHANAGFTLGWYGKYYEAKGWYEQAHRLFEDKTGSPDTVTVAYVHRELGNLYTRFGDHEAAKLLLDRTRQVALKYGANNLAAEATNDLAIVLHDEGKHRQAIEICEAARRLPSLSIVSRALLEGSLSMNFSQAGDRKQALAHADAAGAALEKIIRDSLHANGPLWLSNLLKLRSEILDDPDQAQAALDRSQQLLQQVFPDTLRREFAKLRLSEAGFLLKNGRPNEALSQQQTALRSVLYRFASTDPLANPDPKDFYPENVIFEALTGKAASFQKLYEKTGERAWLESALACHELVFEAERAYRQVHHFESSKLSELAASSRRSEAALEAAWQLHLATKSDAPLRQAFLFSEKSKGILLYEALRHHGASSIANVPDSLLVRERHLRESLAEVEKTLFFKYQKQDTSGLAELNLRVLELTASTRALVEKMETAHPAFFNEKYGQAASTVSEVQAMLRPGQALVEYFTGERGIFIFLVKKDDFQVRRVEKNFPLERWVTDFRQGIEAFQSPANNRDSLCRSYSELAFQLYEKLLQPLENQQLPTDLTIVPGGILGFLPFDALLTEHPSTGCVFKKYPYLVRRHNVSYSYSATLLRELRKKHRGRPGIPFAGFAPAFVEGNGSGFGALRFNVESVAEIAGLFGGQAFTGSAASRQNLLANAAQARLLYLATHAKANTDEGGFSFVVLATEGGYDTLFVKDIYNLPPLLADLVFLGACETGSGKWYDGEGIISLARSFLYAGASSIVTTLWSINDESNRELTLHFFQNLKAGQRKDEALRNAKLALLDSGRPDLFAHPVYWAAYTPIGEMGAVSGRGKMGLVAGAAVAGVAVFWLWRRRRRGEFLRFNRKNYTSRQ